MKIILFAFLLIAVTVSRKRKGTYDHLKTHAMGHDGGVGAAKTRHFLEVAVPYSDFENNDIACSSAQEVDGKIDNSEVSISNCEKHKYFEYYMICTENIIRHTNHDCEHRASELNLKDVTKTNLEKYYDEFHDFLAKYKEKAEEYVKEHHLGLSNSFEHLTPIDNQKVHHKLQPLPHDLHTVNHHSMKRRMKRRRNNE
jgi:hypothetical protein